MDPVNQEDLSLYESELGKAENRYLLLYERSRLKQEKIAKEKELKQRKELEGCTFKPSISTYQSIKQRTSNAHAGK